MKAFIVDRYGSKDCGPGEMPDPELREDETRQRAFSFRILSRQRSRVRVSSSPPFFPNIVVPFLRNAQGRLWALARLYTTRGEFCSYTRQPTTKAPSSLNRNLTTP